MTLKPIKIYLESEDLRKLKNKAEIFFKGKGYISHFISKVAKEPIIFCDSSLREELLKAKKV